jgi:hypothetical protein
MHDEIATDPIPACPHCGAEHVVDRWAEARDAAQNVVRRWAMRHHCSNLCGVTRR